MAKPRFLPATFLACIVALAISSCLAVGTRGAQETPAHPSVLTNPEVNYPLQFDISPALRDMATALSPETAQALPVRHPKLQQLHAQQSQQPSADGALQTSVLPLVNASINLNLLGVGNGFPNYTVHGAPSDVNGFAGTVNLSNSGCPPASTCTFNPASVSPPYPASTLTVSTSRRRTPTGTYTLTIIGTSGTLVHSTNVGLTITR